MQSNNGKTPPNYRLHKQSGQAIATFVDNVTGRRRDVLLGQYNTPQSHAKYHHLVGKWISQGHRLEEATSTRKTAAGSVSVRAVVRAYEGYIRSLVTDGHYRAIKAALDMVVRQQGDTSIERLGPKRLKDVRLEMVGRGWSRSTINRSVRFLVAMLKWAVSEELLEDHGIYAKANDIPNLRAGELGVANGKKIDTIPEARINAVREHLSSVINAMIDLQLVTGMRPGELVVMCAAEIDTSADIWSYEPARHKNQHRGQSREVLLDRQAIAIIKPFMRNRAITAPLFSPRESNAERKAIDAAVGRRKGQKPTPTATDRTMGEAYSVGSYRRAIHRACVLANVDKWSPNQLRHNAATRMRKEYGLETASLLLGHSDATVTAKHYAERDRAALITALTGAA